MDLLEALKKNFKSILPDSWWNCLRDIWKWRYSKFARRSKRRVGWLEFFISGSKAFVKENIKITGRLDYDSAEIKMRVNNCAQLTRLNACAKEPETVEWIEENLKPGEIFYDIGAHVGAYSFVAWSVAKKDCKIYAFEPCSEIFPVLKSNIHLNNAEKEILAFPVALGKKTEKLNDFLFFRLDDFIHLFALDPPNHIKIDVDGPELSVLEGAPETLSLPGLHSILIEVDEEAYPNKEIPLLLEKYGFALKSKYQRGRKRLFNYIFEKTVES